MCAHHIPQGTYVQSWNCYTDRWVTFLGVCIMFSTITAKTFRIWRVFKNPRLQRTIYKPWQVYAIFAAYIGLGLTFLVLYLLFGLLGDETALVEVWHPRLIQERILFGLRVLGFTPHSIGPFFVVNQGIFEVILRFTSRPRRV